MQHKSFLWLLPLVGALALVWGVMTAMPVAAQPATTLGGMVTGRVTSPDGFPLPPGTRVKLFETGGDTLVGQAVPDLNTGTFSLGPVPNGLYVIKAVPPAVSGLTQSLPHPLPIHNAPVDVGDLALTRPQVLGTVYAPDGSTPAGAAVTVFLPDGHPFQTTEALTGTFALGGLPAGTYGIQAYPLGNQPYFRSVPQTFTVSGTLTQSISITLRTADLWGVTQDPLGNPVAGARVVVADRSGHALTSLSRADGFWTLGGLPAGSYYLTALPPRTQGSLLSPVPVSVTLPTASNP
ncbi:MAG: carboxypeptidase regulatory-like domain-containing protein, partial [Anaerolineae bacterium]